MTPSNPLPTRVPLPIGYRSGNRSDLVSLARHHYRQRLPATTCVIRVATIREAHSRRDRVIGVAVLSWPMPMVGPRNRHFGLTGFTNCVRFVNQNLRTISRVIVHPQFRAAGIAHQLVRQLIDRCPTRYVESSTCMGAFTGFLVRSGFVPLPHKPTEPAYFLLDRAQVAPPSDTTSPLKGERR